MLITTARADAVTAKLREWNRVEMLTKPYSPDGLVATLEWLLDRSLTG